MTLKTFRVIHLLPAFRNVIFSYCCAAADKISTDIGQRRSLCGSGASCSSHV